MNTRFLHCGKNLENYYICLNQKIAGFPRKGMKQGDLIYVAVIVDGKNFCGAKFILGEETTDYPWAITDKTYYGFKMNNLEFCKPFQLEKLAEFHDYWRLIFFQSSKAINDKTALKFLKESFEKNKVKEMQKI